MVRRVVRLQSRTAWVTLGISNSSQKGRQRRRILKFRAVESILPVCYHESFTGLHTVLPYLDHAKSSISKFRHGQNWRFGPLQLKHHKDSTIPAGIFSHVLPYLGRSLSENGWKNNKPTNLGADTCLPNAQPLGPTRNDTCIVWTLNFRMHWLHQKVHRTTSKHADIANVDAISSTTPSGSLACP